MIVPKSVVGPINSSKNKLNNEIIFIYNLYPNIKLSVHFSSQKKEKKRLSVHLAFG